MNDLQRRLVEHWIKYMPIQTEYIDDAIRRHFESNPWDKDVMRPPLVEARKALRHD